MSQPGVTGVSLSSATARMEGGEVGIHPPGQLGLLGRGGVRPPGCPRWCHLIPTGVTSSSLLTPCPHCCHLVPTGVTSSPLVPPHLHWRHFVPIAATLSPLVSFHPHWCHLIAATSLPLVPPHPHWCHLVPIGATSSPWPPPAPSPLSHSQCPTPSHPWAVPQFPHLSTVLVWRREELQPRGSHGNHPPSQGVSREGGEGLGGARGAH